jgi:hypothetical protein
VTKRRLGLHRDDEAGAISFVITLRLENNGRGEYKPGGTMYRNVLETFEQVVEAGVGKLVCHAGDIAHGGSPVVNGRRVIIGGFLKPAKPLVGRHFSIDLAGDRHALQNWITQVWPYLK